MGAETETEPETEPKPEPQSSTPKLPLFTLPSQPRESPGMLTPPLQTLASVPFQWEEAPGKPRVCATATPPSSKPKAARCLDLPPRLLNEAKITNTPSPTTVLDGPYSGRSLSHTLSFTFGKASFRSPDGGGPSRKQIAKERWNFGSWRWGSGFKEDDGDAGGDVFDFSPSVGGPSDPSDFPEVKIKRVKKIRSSFFRSSHLWASFYASVKQAVPWRRKQEKQSMNF
ncbi:hypothetical protein U1Q18_004776 [Sarracenia purpurea var. burkii]